MEILLQTKYNEGQIVWTRSFSDSHSFIVEEIVIKIKNGKSKIFYTHKDQLYEEDRLFESEIDARIAALKELNIDHIPVEELERNLIEILPIQLLNKLNEIKDASLYSLLRWRSNDLLKFSGIGNTTISKINDWLWENYQTRLKK